MFRVSAAFLCLLAAAPAPAAERTIDDFFNSFTAEWVRSNPNLATSARYFTGDEQDRLEQRLTPVGLAYQRSRIQLPRKGLADLKKFDRAKMTAIQKQSAELLEWQLDTLIREEPYLHYKFPFQQFGRLTLNLVDTPAANHPLRAANDA